MAEPQAQIIGAEVVDDEIAEDGDLTVQVPIGIPEPAQPSKKEVDRHNLTHVNYKSWCQHCAAGRISNSQHRTQTSNRRNVPLFCSDYSCVRDMDDPHPQTVRVGRLYPSRAIFATACDSKGAEDEAVGR